MSYDDPGRPADGKPAEGQPAEGQPAEGQPADERQRRGRRWARLPLRVKLVIALVSLATVGLVISSVAAGVLLRTYMNDRADDELQNSADQSVQTLAQGGSSIGLGPSGERYVLREYGPDLTELRRTEERIESSLLPQFVPLSPQAAAAAGPRMQTLRSANGNLRWRVTARAFLDQRLGTPASLVIARRMDDVDSTLNRLRVINVVVGFGVLAMLGILGFLVVRSSLRPLRQVEGTAAAIAAGDLSQRVPVGDPGTEVGRLSGALNSMLSQIEDAFRAQGMSEAAARASEERMRRFIADASHELRTPLTSIRGFAELYRQGAVAQPADIASVMRRVEEEAARMGMLVEDLLLLARLDQQRPLAQEPVDLLSIAADIASDARLRQPNRQLTLTTGDSTVLPLVLGDDGRLRQVVSNLVTNALVHTPETAPVAVAVRVVGEFAELEVSDRGPGIPPAHAARVFERFYRADESRTRATASSGSGLGLSIVAALVAAHRGTVRVDSRIGVGTTFTVRLPLLRDEALRPA